MALTSAGDTAEMGAGNAVPGGGAAGRSTAASTTAPARARTGGRDGAAPAIAVTVVASTRWAPVGLSTGRWLLSETLGTPTGAFAAAGASGFDAFGSATRFGRVESSVLTTAASSPVEVSLLDFFDECAPPVAFTIPSGACRTDASVDAEVPDVEVSTAPDSGPEAPSFSEPAAVDVPVGSVVVPVLVAVPSDSEVPFPVVPAVLVVPPLLADAVSSAHATPGVVATATPTPKATANPPTRPMHLALLMFVPLTSHRYGVFNLWAAQAPR